MSDEHSSDNDSGGGVSFLGNSLAIIVPLLMILMLAVTGIAFMGNVEKQSKPSEASADSAGTPAVAAAPAAGADKAAASSTGEVDPAVMAAGQASFGLCAACHGMDGKGLKVGPTLMAPSLEGSEIVLGDPDKMALVILKGLKKENADFMGVMAPLGAALDDEKLAAVMTYTRNSFGNKAPPVPIEEAKKARERFADLTDPTGVSRAKVDEIVAAHKGSDKAAASSTGEVDPAVMAAGQASFGLCAACHGMDGKGLKVGPTLMAPSLEGSEIVLGDPDKMALVILKGLKKENADFMGVMAPLGAALDDEKLAAVMTYTRNSFGNKAPPVPVEEAKKARERFADLTDPTGVSRAKVDEIVAAHK